MRNALKGFALAAAGVLCIGVGSAHAATEMVTEADVVRQTEDTPPTNDWVLYTRAGTPPTAGAFVNGPGSPPIGAGSLQLTTNTAAEKVFLFNYDHVGTPLADVDDISYWTYRSSGSGQQVTGLNLQIDPDGPEGPATFATLVFEPVYNTDQGAVVNNQWQDWIADGSGRWWSTRPLGGGQCAGAVISCMRTWDQIVANNPGATILGGVGVNQGSGNAGLVAATDAFTFDQTTYNFEAGPISKDDCKKGGWESYGAFTNQGDCVSYVATNGKNPPGKN
jgi:hypothetical protein